MFNTFMRICVFVYLRICSGVFIEYFFRCIHCVWPIIPGTNVCLASSPHSCWLCSLYWGTLQVFPKWCWAWLPFANIISKFHLYFIFVSIRISLLSVKISIAGVLLPSSASSPWTLPSLAFSLLFGPWPFSHRRKSSNDYFHDLHKTNFNFGTFFIFKIFPFINSSEQEYLVLGNTGIGEHWHWGTLVLGNIGIGENWYCGTLVLGNIGIRGQWYWATLVLWVCHFWCYSPSGCREWCWWWFYFHFCPFSLPPGWPSLDSIWGSKRNNGKGIAVFQIQICQALKSGENLFLC